MFDHRPWFGAKDGIGDCWGAFDLYKQGGAKGEHSFINGTTAEPCRSTASIVTAAKISTITTRQEEKRLGY
jgi:hypothetical protein